MQAGGWNGVVRNNQDPDLALARVTVELPPGGLPMDVQKSGLQVTAAQAQAFSSARGPDATFEDFLDAAREAKSPASDEQLALPFDRRPKGQTRALEHAASDRR